MQDEEGENIPEDDFGFENPMSEEPETKPTTKVHEWSITLDIGRVELEKPIEGMPEELYRVEMSIIAPVYIFLATLFSDIDYLEDGDNKYMIFRCNETPKLIFYQNDLAPMIFSGELTDTMSSIFGPKTQLNKLFSQVKDDLAKEFEMTPPTALGLEAIENLKEIVNNFQNAVEIVETHTDTTKSEEEISQDQSYWFGKLKPKTEINDIDNIEF